MVFLCQVVKEVTELKKKQLQQYSISNRKKKAFGTSNKLEPLELHNCTLESYLCFHKLSLSEYPCLKKYVL